MKKRKNVVNAADHGSTKEAQATLIALGGGTLLFPAETTWVESGMTIPPNVKWQGQQQPSAG